MADEETDVDDNGPLTRSEIRRLRKILNQNQAAQLLTGYLGKMVIFFAGVATIIAAYLSIRGGSNHGGQP